MNDNFPEVSASNPDPYCDRLCDFGFGICMAPSTCCPHWQGTFCELEAELLKTTKEEQIMMLPCVRYCERYGWQNITWDKKYGIRAGSWNTREEAESALRRSKNGN